MFIGFTVEITNNDTKTTTKYRLSKNNWAKRWAAMTETGLVVLWLPNLSNHATHTTQPFDGMRLRSGCRSWVVKQING